jgi:thioredoxin reductase
MINSKIYDVVIIGGSYAGLSAALTLARAQKTVLIIDNGTPANISSHEAHNFITHEGKDPAVIRKKARKELRKYKTVTFLKGLAQEVTKSGQCFTVQTINKKKFQGKKILFATGIRDIMPGIAGFAECWGKTILHCPYCHGYEVKDKPMAIIANGEHAYHLAVLLSNLSKELTVFTHGDCTLTNEQVNHLRKNKIRIVETTVVEIRHRNGALQELVLEDRSSHKYEVAFAKVLLKQQCEIPERMGCKFTDHLITVDDCMRTTIDGVYAAGDNSYLPRSISIVVSAGTKAAFHINWDLSSTEFAENT